MPLVSARTHKPRVVGAVPKIRRAAKNIAEIFAARMVAPDWPGATVEAGQQRAT
jgi:hypothetical protein